MKFIILGTLTALLCFYAYTEDDEDEKRDQIDFDDDEELSNPLQNDEDINQIQKQYKNKEVSMTEAKNMQMSGKQMQKGKLIVQDIVTEDERRYGSAQKEFGGDQLSNKNQKRAYKSQQPKQYSKKPDQKPKFGVKTPTNNPRQIPYDPAKQKQKYKSQKSAKYQQKYQKGKGKSWYPL